MYEENMMTVTKSDLSAENSNAKTQNSNGDLIYRDDALKPFCVAPDGTRIPEVDCDNFPVEFSVEFIKKHLLSLPSIETVHGEWIEHKGEWVDFDFYPTKYECNQCHYYVDEGYDSIFCPNCGARMKGGDDE